MRWPSVSRSVLMPMSASLSTPRSLPASPSDSRRLVICAGCSEIQTIVHGAVLKLVERFVGDGEVGESIGDFDCVDVIGHAHERGKVFPGGIGVGLAGENVQLALRKHRLLAVGVELIDVPGLLQFSGGVGGGLLCGEDGRVQLEHLLCALKLEKGLADACVARSTTAAATSSLVFSISACAMRLRIGI